MTYKHGLQNSKKVNNIPVKQYCAPPTYYQVYSLINFPEYDNIIYLSAQKILIDLAPPTFKVPPAVDGAGGKVSLRDGAVGRGVESGIEGAIHATRLQWTQNS